ncbi:Protein CBG27839 [Caenorhabditis briggsae]|uniref:Protein CBG27839 n=1 Tax=Caenorhabditis briggsae TaxID=6238 RepID=B6IKC1_CAEBR|nr:Protein CBG27839 [Caenorhabditis briggsae]CAS00351.1 Protein CBG27839 [Caenorhabditis briggsae]
MQQQLYPVDCYGRPIVPIIVAPQPVPYQLPQTGKFQPAQNPAQYYPPEFGGYAPNENAQQPNFYPAPGPMVPLQVNTPQYSSVPLAHSHSSGRSSSHSEPVNVGGTNQPYYHEYQPIYQSDGGYNGAPHVNNFSSQTVPATGFSNQGPIEQQGPPVNNTFTAQYQPIYQSDGGYNGALYANNFSSQTVPAAGFSNHVPIHQGPPVNNTFPAQREPVYQSNGGGYYGGSYANNSSQAVQSTGSSYHVPIEHQFKTKMNEALERLNWKKDNTQNLPTGDDSKVETEQIDAGLGSDVEAEEPVDSQADAPKAAGTASKKSRRVIVVSAKYKFGARNVMRKSSRRIQAKTTQKSRDEDVEEMGDAEDDEDKENIIQNNDCPSVESISIPEVADVPTVAKALDRVALDDGNVNVVAEPEVEELIHQNEYQSLPNGYVANSKLSENKMPAKGDSAPPENESQPLPSETDVNSKLSSSETKMPTEQQSISPEKRSDIHDKESEVTPAPVTKVVDYSKWVNRNQIYKKWIQESQEEDQDSEDEIAESEAEEKVVQYDVLAPAEELPHVALKTTVQRKPSNPGHQKAFASSQAAKPRESKKKQKKQKASKSQDQQSTSKVQQQELDIGEKVEEDWFELEKKDYDEMKKIINEYGRYIHSFRIIAWAFKKERPAVHSFQSNIIEFYRKRLDYALDTDRKYLETDKYAELRAKVYAAKKNPRGIKMYHFLRIIKSSPLPAFDADLLYLYDSPKPAPVHVISDLEEGYFDMVLSFRSWKPELPGTAVSVPDLKTLPYKLHDTHLRRLAYHINFQSYVRYQPSVSAEERHEMGRREKFVTDAYFEERQHGLNDTWVAGDTMKFLISRVKHLEKTDMPISNKLIDFYKFLICISSSIIHFDAYWFNESLKLENTDDKYCFHDDLMFIEYLFGCVNIEM